MVDQLAAVDPATADRAAIAAIVDDLRQVRSWVDARETHFAARIALLAAIDGGDGPAAVIAAGARFGGVC